MQGLIIRGTMALVLELVVMGETQCVALKSCRWSSSVLWFVQEQVTLSAESKASTTLAVEPGSGRWTWNLDRSCIPRKQRSQRNTAIILGLEFRVNFKVAPSVSSPVIVKLKWIIVIDLELPTFVCNLVCRIWERSWALRGWWSSCIWRGFGQSKAYHSHETQKAENLAWVPCKNYFLLFFDP